MEQTLLPWLIRIEAINISNFITDNDDISTIRGAGLLLLNANRFLCGLSDEGDTLGTPGLLRQSSGKFLSNAEISVEIVSTGASNCLLSFEASETKAEMFRQEVADWLRTHEFLCHATFAVVLTKSESSFGRTMEKSLLQARLAQMRQPNVSFGQIQTSMKAGIAPNFCDIDQVRARSCDLNREPKQDEYSAYAKAADKNYVSLASYQRRKYGRRTKVNVYQMVSKAEGSFEQFRPSWEFEEIARRDSWCTDEDTQSFTDEIKDPFGSAKNKIAVIYIDGNKFGSLIRKYSKTQQDYSSVDSTLQSYRRKLMRAFVGKIQSNPCWQVWPRDIEGKRAGKPKTRIETLLWGGDELIWVVPAWTAIDSIKFFFDYTSKWNIRGDKLTHAVGLAICSYKSPVRAVVGLAKELAESAKKHLDCRNGLAYEVLESFDHLGRDFDEARRDRRFPQMEDGDAILSEKGLNAIDEHLLLLKHGSASIPSLPKRRIHQIAQLLHRTKNPISLDEKSPYAKLVARIAQTTTGDKSYEKTLNDPLHWEEPSKLAAKWFHLMELWDYGGFQNPHPFSTKENA